MLDVSLRTLQEWEQGRRVPTGPAMTLLRIYDAIPEAVTNTEAFAEKLAMSK